MLDLVGNPEDRFSHNEVHIIFYLHSYKNIIMSSFKSSKKKERKNSKERKEYPRSKSFIEKFMTFRVRAITINCRCNRLCNMHRYSKTVIRKKNMIFSILLLKTLRRFYQVPTK